MELRPVLGDDDQIARLETTAEQAVTLAPQARLEVIPGAPHGPCTTHKDFINSMLLRFLKS
ncbi:MAG: hypothetical protein F2754_16645 [Actinobacteria bacterium]|nr:hypothetical protein [Actinomycetota bacterium]